MTLCSAEGSIKCADGLRFCLGSPKTPAAGLRFAPKRFQQLDADENFRRLRSGSFCEMKYRHRGILVDFDHCLFRKDCNLSSGG